MYKQTYTQNIYTETHWEEKQARMQGVCFRGDGSEERGAAAFPGRAAAGQLPVRIAVQFPVHCMQHHSAHVEMKYEIQ